MGSLVQRKNLAVWALPILFIVVQCLPEHIGMSIVCVLFLLSILLKSTRGATLLLAFSICGYFVWLYISPLISAAIGHTMLGQTLARFALVGYIVIFALWDIFSKRKAAYLSIGKAKEIIRFPFIWRGYKEPIWRFTLIFCCICVIPLCAGIFSCRPALELLGYGVLFSVVNAFLEEIIWRGMILSHAVSLVGEKHALIITSLAFGLYHISLGFPIWVCLIFAVGGIYMGGTAIVSKGLLAPFFMHILVNLIFVVFGMVI